MQVLKVYRFIFLWSLVSSALPSFGMQNKKTFWRIKYNFQNGWSAFQMIKQFLKPDLITDVRLQNCGRSEFNNFFTPQNWMKVKGRYQWHNKIWRKNCIGARINLYSTYLPDQPVLFCGRILSSNGRSPPFKSIRRLFFSHIALLIWWSVFLFFL